MVGTRRGDDLRPGRASSPTPTRPSAPRPSWPAAWCCTCCPHGAGFDLTDAHAGARRGAGRPRGGGRDRRGRARPAPDGPRHRRPTDASPDARSGGGGLTAAPDRRRRHDRATDRLDDQDGDDSHDRTPHARPHDPRDPRLPRRQHLVLRQGDPPRRRPRARSRSSRPTPSRLHRPPAGDAARPARALLLARQARRLRRAAQRGHLARPRRRAPRAGAAAGGRPRHPPRQDPRGEGPAGPLQRDLRVRRRAGRPRRRRGSPYAWSTTWSRPTPSSTGTTELESFILRAERTAFGPSTQAILDEAVSRDIPWIRLNQHSLVQLGQGVHAKRIRATMTSETSAIAVDIASDKDLTTRLLGAAGLPVPKQETVRTADQAVAGGRADRLPGRAQAARRQPRPRRLPRPAGRGRRARGVRDRQGGVAARRDRGRVADHRQGLPLPDHRRPGGRDRRAGAGLGHRRRHLDRRAAGRPRQRRPAPRRRPREGADPDQGRRRRRSRWCATRGSR